MRVGLVSDPIYLEHDTGQHIENRRRLEEVLSLLEQSQLLKQLVAISPRAASEEELITVHAKEQVLRVKSLCQQGGGWLDADTVVGAASYEVALLACGGVLAGIDAVLGGRVDSVFALVRPPGHHATPRRSMGFCLFNNIAVAAKYALKRYTLERILIADFDCHHGNGTQEAFADDPRALYLSIHQYPFYPGTGAIEEGGCGEGRGSAVNVPLPAWCSDKEYQRVFQEILVPVAERFQPQLLMVSAGYDSHWADQISLMQVSVDGFAGMISILKKLAGELCNGQLVFALEGGYHLQALSYSIKATLEVLLGEHHSPDPLGQPPMTKKPPSIEPILEAVKKRHGLG